MSASAVPCASGDRGLAGRLAELPGVLPHRHRLRAEGDPVQGGEIAVLTRHRHLTGQSLGLECSDDATRHAVVGCDDGLDVVVVLRQELLHVRLGDGRVPVVRVGLAHVDDVT